MFAMVCSKDYTVFIFCPCFCWLRTHNVRLERIFPDAQRHKERRCEFVWGSRNAFGPSWLCTRTKRQTPTGEQQLRICCARTSGFVFHTNRPDGCWCIQIITNKFKTVWTQLSFAQFVDSSVFTKTVVYVNTFGNTLTQRGYLKTNSKNSGCRSCTGINSQTGNRPTNHRAARIRRSKRVRSCRNLPGGCFRTSF